MSSKIKVKDNKNLVRDCNNGAILNTDITAVNAYRSRKNDINKIKMLETKVLNMEDNLAQIKNLLQLLVEGKNNK